MIYKRGKTYWYKFTWNGRQIRESAKTGNPKTARQIESARKTELAKGEVGIKDKPQAPKFSDYAENWITATVVIFERSGKWKENTSLLDFKSDQGLFPKSTARLAAIEYLLKQSGVDPTRCEIEQFDKELTEVDYSL